MANKKKRDRKAKAIVAFFDERYGEDGPTLEAWQKFCGDVGVTQGPSITQCKKILNSVNVNIVDFVHAMKNEQPVVHYKSRSALARYIAADMAERCFPLSIAKKDSFLKTLLIQLSLSRC